MLALAFLPWIAFATDKNGVSPNAISLPSGPGSIEGLGDSFQPALNSGTMRHSLSLQLPPGTAGHAPDLLLSYEGGQGNGPLGFGWSLPLPFVQRQTDKGIPRYVDGANGVDDDRDGQMDEADELDTFINDSKEELVPVATGDYFCKNEGAFIRYRRRGDHWEGTLPSGTRMEFGLTAAGRMVDSAITNHVFKWLLERETDTHGNTIVYTWQTFPGSTNINQKYLKEIRYGPGAPPWANFHFVAFTYEDRTDWFEDCRSGFVVRTGKRLKELTVGTQGVTPVGHANGDFNSDGGPDVLNRKYRLIYLDYAPGQSHWSLLHEVTQVGADNVSTLPPARFDYAVCQPPPTASASNQLIGGTNEPPFAMDNANVELLDLNADGLPDLLRTGAAGGVHIAYLNRGELTNAGGRAINWAPAQQLASADGLAWNVTLQSGTDVANLSDMNGDGLADLAYKSALGDVFFFANRGSLGWGNRQLMNPQDTQPPAPFGNPNARSADLDFDKRMDVIESISSGSGADYRIWFNLGNQRYARSITVPQTSGFLFSLSGVVIADFNGDRVPDILRIQPSAITATAGLGYGNFAPPVTAPIPDWTLDGAQIAKARLEDINGDGLADLVLERAAPGQIWYWLNKGNYTLDSRRIITGLPGGLSTTTRWADLNGDGVTDLLYADSTATPRMLTVDLGHVLGCVPSPNTLTRIENGIGGITRIEYAASTRFALEDAAAGQSWTNQLPFPVTVVARVLTADSLGHTYETRFKYHQGYYDAVEKEFRGFASAEQIDVGDTTAPTLVSRSYFDTGRDFVPMKGKLLRLTVEQEDGKAFSDEMTTWTIPPRTLYAGTNGQAVSFVHETAKTKSVKELGQGTERMVESEFAFDAYGNQTLEANYGIVVDGDRSAFDDERITTNQFALNLDAWIVRRPSRSEIRDENGSIVSRVENFYDDETFSGNNLGQMQTGNLTMRREWLAPANPGAFVAATRTHYDTFGNPVAQLDPLAVAPGGAPDAAQGHFREVSYDPEFHTHAVSETVHLEAGKASLITQADYDPGFGKLVAARDYNNHQTTYGYDAFARLQRVIRPGDTAAYPTTEYDYVVAQSAGSNRLVNFAETRSLDQPPGAAGSKRDHYFISRQFTDGLGRALMTKKEAEPAPGTSSPRVVIEAATVFNARQKPVLILSPCFTTAGGSLEQLLDFEDVSLPGWQGLFHKDGQLVPLDLAAAHKTSTQYDAMLRETGKTNADGTFTRTAFEPFLETRYDENDTAAGSPHEGTPHVLHQDGLGRQIRTDEMVRLADDGTPSGGLNTWTTTYQFDLNDQLVRITDSQGNVKRMAFDGLKRLVSMNDPDRGVSTNKYDAASNLIESRDAKGQRITYTYDGANRLLTEDYHDEGLPVSAGYAFDPALPVSATNRPDIAYFYDAPTPGLDLGNGSTGSAQNTKGMLAFVWDLSGEEHRSYDARRREEWTVKRIRDPRDRQLVSYQIRQDYDPMDGLVQTVYPDNDAVAYAYNERHLLRRIWGDRVGSLLTQIDYLPSGQFREMAYGNGVVSSSTYDPRSRLTSLRTARSSVQGQPYVDLAYEFDGVSNIREIHDLRPAMLVPDGSPRRNSQSFEYDDLYRLTQVRYSLGPAGAPSTDNNKIAYRYDRIGNLVSQNSDLTRVEQGRSLLQLGSLSYGGALGSSGRDGRNSSEPGPHALSQWGSATNSSTLSYDANGNVSQKGGALFTWDFKDRLVAVETASTRSDYTYDYRHRRVIRHLTSKQAAGTNAPGNAAAPEITFYVSPLYEVRPTASPIKYVWNGSSRIARISGSLSGNLRVQRLRLAAGWNLVALAVTVPDLLQQLPFGPPPNGSGPRVEAAYRWDQQAQTFVALTPNDAGTAGSVLWLNVESPGTLSLTGSFEEPNAAPTVSAPGFVSWPAFEPLPAGTRLPADLAAWCFAAEEQRWRTQLPGIAPGVSGTPSALAPGEALFVRPAAATTLSVPDQSLRVRYYHADHLGSATVMTDASGNLVEETAYFPFGVPRNEERPRQTSEPYQFTGKERDPESGLHYFEARYLAGDLARFISPDPAYAEPERLEAHRFRRLLDHPQAFNLYAYAHNNPLTYTDPTGYDPTANDLEARSGQTLPNAVLQRSSVLPWKTRAGRITVLAGHGLWARADEIEIKDGQLSYKKGGSYEDPGFTVVPPGTTITFYAYHGQNISDPLGNAIEENKLHPDQYRVTYYPGDRIPNYALVPPKGLEIHKTPGVELVTVAQPTSLHELLKPGMGAVHWAACRETLEGPKNGVTVVKPDPTPKK